MLDLVFSIRQMATKVTPTHHRHQQDGLLYMEKFVRYLTSSNQNRNKEGKALSGITNLWHSTIVRKAFSTDTSQVQHTRLSPSLAVVAEVPHLK